MEGDTDRISTDNTSTAKLRMIATAIKNLTYSEMVVFMGAFNRNDLALPADRMINLADSLLAMTCEPCAPGGGMFPGDYR